MGGPNDILGEENDIIDHFLGALRGMASAMEQGEMVPEPDIDDSLALIVGFADKCHFAKEEFALFPALRRANAVEGDKMAKTIEGDHEAAQKLASTLRFSAGDAAGGDRESMKTFAHAARLLSKLLMSRIRFETDQLFPLVQKSLRSSQQKDLAKEFERIELEEIGEGAHGRYAAMVQRLAERYVETPAAAA